MKTSFNDKVLKVIDVLSSSDRPLRPWEIAKAVKPDSRSCDSWIYGVLSAAMIVDRDIIKIHEKDGGTLYYYAK